MSNGDRQNLYAYLAGVGAAIIFGFSFLFTKNALDHIMPFHLIALRFTLAAILLTVLVISGIAKVSYKGKDLKPLLIIGVFQPITYFFFETYGIQMTSSSQAGMMIALIPIVVTVLSAKVLKEYATRLQTLFILISVAGVMFIIYMQSTSATTGGVAGYFVLLGAVFSAALFNILSRKSSANFKPLEITLVMMWMGAIVFNLVSLTQHGLNHNLASYFAPLQTMEVVTSLIYLGAISSVLAFLLINYALSELMASQAAVFANLTTVVSIVAGIIFRNEPFLWFHVVGALMILLGVWGTNYFSKKRARRGAVINHRSSAVGHE